MRAKLFFLVALLALLPTLAPAHSPDDIREHPTCKYCEMNRQHFAHSRMLILYDDGSSFGACSLHCAALNLVLNPARIPISIDVADYNTHELIDAESASWVIGGNKPGVMTRRAKWAFRHSADAKRFMQWNGGRLGSLDDAIKAAYEDMYEDSRLIRGKRKIRRMLKSMPQ